MQTISVTRTEHLKEKPLDESKLGFGRIFTDHMFIMDYDPENGWHDAPCRGQHRRDHRR